VVAESEPKGADTADSFESAAAGIEYVPRLAGTTHVTTTRVTVVPLRVVVTTPMSTLSNPVPVQVMGRGFVRSIELIVSTLVVKFLGRVADTFEKAST
jgi:hypothetical protein